MTKLAATGNSVNDRQLFRRPAKIAAKLKPTNFMATTQVGRLALEIAARLAATKALYSRRVPTRRLPPLLGPATWSFTREN
ncbi:unnamed protein product [Colias eurytheme]|nr:unnamed protein product [Colias eurytheme]